MRRFFAVAAAAAMALGGLLGTASSAAAQSQALPTTHVSVQGNGNSARVTLSRSTVPAGRLVFSVSSSRTQARGGSDVVLLHPRAGVSLARVFADFRDEFSQHPATAARGTRELTRDARFYGLAQVDKGHPVTVTQHLTGGTYYLLDLDEQTGVGPHPVATRFTVRGRDDNADAESGGRGPLVRLTSADRFVTPGTLPARGTITVRNTSDTVHFMALQPVKKGTTDRQIQRFFDSGSHATPPFFVRGPTAGMGPQSPGRQAQFTYRLPAGTYVMLCFVADDRTGIPHAIMGMHKVVTLK